MTSALLRVAQTISREKCSCGQAGDLRYVHYVNTYETYPRYCEKAPPSGFPSQLECDGAGAT